VGRDADPEVLRIASASIAAVPPASYRQALLALVEFDRREALASLAVPTLVVAGALDQNAPPAVMEKMAARIPGAQFAVIPGAGHLMHWEEPEAFNRLVLEFLDQSLASDRLAPAP
jgi:pimeloyl-ACP methyl ester carboxylesterase